jgi:hypothetical protein
MTEREWSFSADLEAHSFQAVIGGLGDGFTRDQLLIVGGRGLLLADGQREFERACLVGGVVEDTYPDEQLAGGQLDLLGESEWAAGH